MISMQLVQTDDAFKSFSIDAYVNTFYEERTINITPASRNRRNYDAACTHVQRVMEGRAASIIKLVCINVVYSVWPPLPSVYISRTRFYSPSSASRSIKARACPSRRNNSSLIAIACAVHIPPFEDAPWMHFPG